MYTILNLGSRPRLWSELSGKMGEQQNHDLNNGRPTDTSSLKCKFQVYAPRLGMTHNRMRSNESSPSIESNILKTEELPVYYFIRRINNGLFSMWLLVVENLYCESIPSTDPDPCSEIGSPTSHPTVRQLHQNPGLSFQYPSSLRGLRYFISFGSPFSLPPPPHMLAQNRRHRSRYRSS